MWKFVRPLVLNDPSPDGDRSPRAAHAQAEDLLRQALAALGAAATADGKIDYASLRGSSAWANGGSGARPQLVPLADLIGRAPGSGSTSTTRCAARHRGAQYRKSVLVPFFFMRASYRIGGFREPGRYRARRVARQRSPASAAARPFGRLDPRGALALGLSIRASTSPQLRRLVVSAGQTYRAGGRSTVTWPRNIAATMIMTTPAVSPARIFRWYRQ
jgi:hypothetical protein